MNSGECPVPFDGASRRVTLADGEGGRSSRQWIERAILPLFQDVKATTFHDAAKIKPCTSELMFTTDSFVVTPRFFPGGDIGRLAVFGTANDLSVSGARPKWMSLSMILEEGLDWDEVDRVLRSVKMAADEANVAMVAGDTKVVPRGAVDGIFLNTAGVGELFWELPGCNRLQVGDQLLVSGPIGCHGYAVLCARESLDFDPQPSSDCGLLHPAVEALWAAQVAVRAVRDATRGGVSAVLHEWAQASDKSFRLDRTSLPLTDVVRGVSELLGLDPLHVACEGTMVIAVSPADCERALEVLQAIEISRLSCRIGEVTSKGSCPVLIRSSLGRELPLDEPAGAPLPRIC